MFIYEVLLVTGVLGLIAMSLAGLGHHGGAHHAGHTVYVNRSAQKSSVVPRHREINDFLIA